MANSGEDNENYFKNLVDSSAFSAFFYTTILLNSIILAIPNYAEIDLHGNLSTTTSLRNAIFVNSDVVFLVFFSVELLLKICAYGLIGEGSYLNDSWNSLDLLVVIAGWVSYGFPKGGSYIIVFRLVRVFRPLKSLSKNSELRKVVTVIISSAPQLGNVAIVACFAFLFFSIAGLQFFSGPEMHTRCRLTPFPVKTDWTIGSPYQNHRCLLADNIDLAEQFPKMKKSESPWATTVSDCFWPVDPTNVHVCSFTSSGLNVCHHGTNLIPESEWTWCGSNYDGFGNPRFTDWKLMGAPVYSKDLRWGHINFDNVLMAFLVIYEVVTLNHWTEIMYMVQDAFGGLVALYFIVVDLVGTFVIMNLLLTSIKNTVDLYKASIRNSDGGTGAVDNGEEATEPNSASVQKTSNTNLLDWNVKILNVVVDHSVFKRARVLLISICTLMLTINYNATNSNFSDVLERSYFIFAIIFMGEMLLTMTGQGLRRYFSSALSIVDFVVISLTFIQACLYPPCKYMLIDGGNCAEMWRGRSFGMGLLSWRFGRVLRFIMTYFEFEYAKSYFAMITKTMVDCVAFSIVFVVYIYIASLVGMQLFANKLRFNAQGYPIAVTNREAWLNAPDRPRANFDDFFLSIGSVFQIVSSEKWYMVMDDLWRAQGSGAAAFAIITLTFGMYVLLFQLLTFIIDDVAEGSSEGRSVEFESTDTSPVVVDIIFDPEKANPPRIKDTVKMALKRSRNAKSKQRPIPLELVSLEDAYSSPSIETIQTTDSENVAKKGINAPARSKRIILGSNVDRPPTTAYEYLEFACRVIYRSPGYKSITAAISLFSAVQLALDSPFLDPASKYAKVMLILNGVFTAYIGAANIIDILGQGPAQYFSSMWAWGDLAVTVVSVIGLFISNQAMIGVRVVKIFNTMIHVQSLQIFHGLNITIQSMVGVVPDALFVTWFFSTCLIFFALFTVSSLKGQLRSCHGDVFDRSISQHKVYMSALTTPKEWSAMPADTRQMFAPTSAVFTLYDMSSQASAVCGSSWPSQPCCLDKGTSAPYVGEPLVATSRSYCECWGGSWEPDTIYLFDNVAQAFFTLFQMATMEGWVELKAIVTDATGIDMQPIRDNRSSWIFFFIVFIVAGFFLCINLFIGEVVKSFQSNLSRDEEAFLSIDEFVCRIRGKDYTREDSWLSMFKNAGQNEIKDWRVQVSKRLLKRWGIPEYEQDWENLSSYRPSQRLAAAIVGNVYFDNFMICSILANTVVLALPYFGANEEYLRHVDTANMVCAIIFNVELLINVLAKGPYLFFRLSSCFDAVIVIGTDLEMGLSTLFGSSSSSQVISLGRMGRMLKLVRMFRLPQLQQLIEVLAAVTSTIFNVGVFLFFMVFIFAVIGFKSFAKTAFNDIYDEYANFRSIDVSLLTMFRFLTGQSWDDFMHAAATKTAGCVDNPAYDPQVCGFNNDLGCEPLNGCGSFGIYPFMILYVLIASFCCLSLFVAAIVDGLSTIGEESLFNVIDVTARGRFVGCWLQYDKQASGFISVEDLEKLVLDEDNPFKLFVALKTNFTLSEAVEAWSRDPASLSDRKSLRDAVGVLPLAVKLGQGCLACEVFKVLFFSADNQLVDLTAGRKLEIETMKLLDRPDPYWLSLREYYAATVIARACFRHMMRNKYFPRNKIETSGVFATAGKVISDIASSFMQHISTRPVSQKKRKKSAV